MRINHKLLILFFSIALIIRIIFLSIYHEELFNYGLIEPHGELAFNTRFNNWFVTEINHSIKIQQERQKKNKIIDPGYILPSVEKKFKKWSTLDTPFYGTFMGIIWKFTPGQKYIYIQILQIIIDSLMIFLIFGIGKNLFSKKIGLLSAFLFAVWLPEAKLSIYPLRDIWGAFGYITILYFFSKAFLQNPKKQVLTIFMGSIFFSLCGLLRPNIIFLSLFLAFFTFFIWRPKVALRNILILINTTIIVFWLPLIFFNLHTYQRIFVGPVGQGFWSGLGEFNNPWGAKLFDGDLERVVKEAGYSYAYGTPEFDDVLKSEFIQAIKERPDIYISHLIKRIPRYLSTKFPLDLEYTPCRLENKSIITCIKENPIFFVANPYQLFYVLIGGLAFFLYKKHRKYIIFCLLVPGYAFFSSWQSHFEDRYVHIGNSSFIILTSLVLMYFYEKWIVKNKKIE